MDDINLFLDCGRDVACNVPTTTSNVPSFNVHTQNGSIIMIPCTWFGITTNSSSVTFEKCFGNSYHVSFAISPASDKTIFPSDILPKYDIIPCVHIVTKYLPDE
jgi:hypothetical protein